MTDRLKRRVFVRPRRGEPLARDPTKAPAAVEAPVQKPVEAPTVAAAPEQVPENAPAREPSLLRDVLLLLLKVGTLLLALVLLFTFMYGLHRTVEPSMKPAVQDGDLLIFYRLDKTYVIADVVLLDYEGQRQARRVVAMAGDVVDITEDGLFINGALQQEPDIYQPTQRYVDGVSFPLTVGEGQVFVLADARVDATDSRVYGPVDVNDTMGKVITVLRRRNI